MNIPRTITPRRQLDLPYFITLTCGCKVRTRSTPRSSNTLFCCTSGLSHGYSLPWVSWEDTDSGRTGTNSRQEGKES